MTDTNDGGEIRKRAGAQPAGAQANQMPKRSFARAQDREPARDQAREAHRGGVIVQGHNGEVLTRRHRQVGDPYHVPPEFIPPGWDYQWNTVTVINEVATDQQNIMYANGWRPVPASRHPGHWTPIGYDGSIVRNGQRLEERPKSLGEEARAEEIAKAYGQVRDQTDSLRLTDKMPKGYAFGGRRGTGADVRISVDRALDIPAPQHQMAEPGD